MISLKFVLKVQIDNIPALVPIMAWRRPGDKPLSETMMVSLLTLTCVTRPQRIMFWDINEPCFLSDFHNIICTVVKLLSPPVVPRRICYRSYRHFNEESYVKDLHSAPFTICDIFDDPGDKAWCFTKVLSDVMEKNAPVNQRLSRTLKYHIWILNFVKLCINETCFEINIKRDWWGGMHTGWNEISRHPFIRNHRLPILVNVVQEV